MLTEKERINRFAEKFDKMIRESGMSKRMVAEKIGVTPTAVTCYTNGTRIPKAIIMYNIAELFHVPVSDLLSLTVPAGEEITTNDIKPSTLVNMEHTKRKEGARLKRELINMILDMDDVDVETALKLLKGVFAD